MPKLHLGKAREARRATGTANKMAASSMSDLLKRTVGAVTDPLSTLTALVSSPLQAERVHDAGGSDDTLTSPHALAFEKVDDMLAKLGPAPPEKALAILLLASSEDAQQQAIAAAEETAEQERQRLAERDEELRREAAEEAAKLVLEAEEEAHRLLLAAQEEGRRLAREAAEAGATLLAVTQNEDQKAAAEQQAERLSAQVEAACRRVLSEAQRKATWLQEEASRRGTRALLAHLSLAPFYIFFSFPPHTDLTGGVCSLCLLSLPAQATRCASALSKPRRTAARCACVRPIRKPRRRPNG